MLRYYYMKVISCFLLAIIPFSIFAQITKDQLEGVWIATYREHADGSKIIDKKYEGYDFSILAIKNDTFSLSHFRHYSGNLTFGLCYLNVDTLFLNKNKYKVEYFKNDSLIITESISFFINLISPIQFVLYFIVIIFLFRG